MKISIITPTYNYGRFLPDAIESVALQDYPHKEHIIVDAKSSDNTLDVLRQYEHLPHLRWISEPDNGQTDAINKGFRMATGDIVAWLNADDYYLPGAFQHVADGFAKHPEAQILYGDTLFVDGDKKALRVKKDHAFNYGVLLYYGCYIQSTSTFFRRGIVDRDDLLDDSYRVVMDYEYFVRLAALGYRFQYYPEIMAAFRWHDTNVSATFVERRREERLRVLREHGFQWTSDDARQEKLYDLAFQLYRIKRGALKLQAALF